MILTAVFKKYTSERVTGPRGGQKWVTKTTEVVDTLHPVQVSFYRETKTFYIRGCDQGKESQSLYTATGESAMGGWQHGQHGSKIHYEPIHLYDGVLVTRAPYCSGQKIDQHKYLKSI